MINRRGHARFLLQMRGLVESAFEILAQKFQGHEPVEQCVARFVNGSHSAHADRLYDHKMVEHALGPHFFAAVGTLNARKRLCVACVDRSGAGRTSLRCRYGRFSRH